MNLFSSAVQLYYDYARGKMPKTSLKHVLKHAFALYFICLVSFRCKGYQTGSLHASFTTYKKFSFGIHSYLSGRLKFVFSPDVILCGRLGLRSRDTMKK